MHRSFYKEDMRHRMWLCTINDDCYCCAVKLQFLEPNITLIHAVVVLSSLIQRLTYLVVF